MYRIERAEESDIQNSEYGSKNSTYNAYSIVEGDKPIAYMWFEVKNSVMHLTLFEVIEKSKGTGTKIIHFLFEHLSLSKIEGFSMCEQRAYRFWERLGAKFYYVEEEGYEIDELLDAEIESPFTLIM